MWDPGQHLVVAFCLITCIVNSINCVWVAVAGLLVPDFIYNIGTTVLNGGISIVIFFFVNKIGIFPEAYRQNKPGRITGEKRTDARTGRRQWEKSLDGGKNVIASNGEIWWIKKNAAFP